MALRRVTMQAVADACGLSRNTVSKIFNNRGTVPETTKQLVLKKAQELGYLPPSVEAPANTEPHRQNIVLLTCHMPTDYHFGTLFIPAFAGQLSRAGYTLMMYELSREELRQGSLPAHMDPDQTAGILGIELFDSNYQKKLCALGLPIIFVDDCYGANMSLMQHDRISMECLSSTTALVNHVIAQGAKRIGFVGDFQHCNSFYERWEGFCIALSSAGIRLDRELCILERDDSSYSDPAWLYEKVRQMPQLPDALICANDFIAIKLMTAFKQMGVLVPQQVMIAGFDGTPQSAVLEPSLTTVEIPSADIGRIAADILLDRIENPDRPFRCTYVKATPVFRGSTDR